MPLFSSKRSKLKQKIAPAPDAFANADNIIQAPYIRIAGQRPSVSGKLAQYKPIDSTKQEIRLLQLFPGTSAALLRCSIQHMSLLPRRRQEYKTVSYCWGQCVGFTDIEIDDVAAKVTRSSAQALRQMRDPKTPMMIWIDAICINQENDDEKSAQVTLMAEIYRNASTNLVYLGPESGHPLKTQATLQAVSARMRKHTKKKGLKTINECFYVPHSRHLQYDGDDSHTGVDLEPLRLIFSCRWFRRLWIVQEVALARRNVCYVGDTTFQLRDILNIAMWLNHNQQVLPYDIIRMPGVRAAMCLWHTLEYTRPTSAPLYTKWVQLYETEATTDPRDNIYALLGLCEPFVQQGQQYGKSLLRVDYKASKEIVFRDATRAMIIDGSMLDPLHFARGIGCNGGGLSWTIAFDNKDGTSKDPMRLDYRYFRASCFFNAEILQCQDPNVLALRGYDFGEVHSCSDRLQTENMRRGSALTSIKSIWSLFRDPAKYNADIAATLIDGINSTYAPAGKADVEDYEEFVRYLKDGQGARIGPRNPQLSPEERVAIVDRYWTAVHFACERGRRFFRTASGYLGLGHVLTQRGDRVVVLPGGKVPYILRPLRGQRYQLVGECYVNGLMYGHSFKKKADAKEPYETFMIQ